MIFIPTRVFVLLVCLFFIYQKGLCQAGFSSSAPLCVAATATLSANSGTLTPSAYQWSSAQTGVLFTQPTLSVTEVVFPAAGLYTITLAIYAGTLVSYSTQTLQVHPLPQITLSSTSASMCVGQGATLTVSGGVSYTWSPSANLYFLSISTAYTSPNSTSTFSVSGTNSFGCSDSTAYTLVVDNYPNLLVLPSATAVCSGYGSTLTAGGASQYTWTSTSFSTPLVQSTLVVGPGIYSVVAANGVCMDSSVVTIYIAPPILLQVNLSRNLLCSDDSVAVPINLSATGASYYSWQPYQPLLMTYSLGPNTQVTPTVTTCYTVTGTTNDCESKTEVCVQVNTCTAIEEHGQAQLFSVYPNPAFNQVFIETHFSESLCVRLMNLSGKILRVENWPGHMGSARQFSLDPFPAGMYVLCITPSGELPHYIRLLKH